MPGEKATYPVEKDIYVNKQVVLSSLYQNDLDDLVCQISDPEIYRNTLKISYPYTCKDGERFISHLQDAEEALGIKRDWAIRYRGSVIGGIGLLYNYGIQSHKSEMGYWLGKQYRNRGIMTTVIRKFANHIFATRSLVRLEANVFVFNNASARVLEKAGFQKEGMLRSNFKKEGKYLDSYLYSRIKATTA